MSDQFGQEEFARAMNVSRETMDRFARWKALLQRWSGAINLVSPDSLKAFWIRHALDSAQLAALAPKGAKTFIDLGSGAGFPGLAIALMLRQDRELSMTLVEANAKKAAFLRAAIKETGAPAEIVNARTEAMPARPYDVITARALAPLETLLMLAVRFSGPDTVMLFPKGRNVLKELRATRGSWALEYDVLPSCTDKDASIVKIGNAARV